jgi:hypothetical protein
VNPRPVNCCIPLAEQKCAGGATGAIAWGEALQSSAQPQGYEVHDMISPGGAPDFEEKYLW